MQSKCQAAFLLARSRASVKTSRGIKKKKKERKEKKEVNEGYFGMQEVHKMNSGQLSLSHAHGWKSHARADSFNAQVGTKVILHKFPKCLNYLRF